MKKLLSFFDIKFLKFVIVGAINTAVDYGLFLVLRCICPATPLWLHWLLVTAIPCATASVLSYFLNKYFTFHNTEKGWKPAIRFALNIAACYVIAYGIAIPFMKWALSSVEAGWADTITKIVGMVLFSGVNYIGQCLFAFKETSPAKDEKPIK